MAKKVVVELTDDVDGKAIADGKGGTVRFSLDLTRATFGGFGLGEALDR